MHEDKSHLNTRANCPVEQLEWFVNNTLSVEEYNAVEMHLKCCVACRQEVAEWADIRVVLQIANTLTPLPRADLFCRIEQQINTSLSRSWMEEIAHFISQRWAILFEHCSVQLRLIRRDLWWMPLLIVPLSIFFAFIPSTGPDRMSIQAFMASLITALGMAVFYGQETDPAREMILVTPTSPRLMLSVRCCLVFCYNLLINLVGVLPFVIAHTAITPTWFIANWLAPLCFLTAVTFFVCNVVNAPAAVLLCAFIGIMRLISNLQNIPETYIQQRYESFWHQGTLLFTLSVCVVVMTLVFYNRRELLRI